jgi:hypothetical protein
MNRSLLLVSIFGPRGPNRTLPAAPHAGGRHKYNGVLLGEPRGSLITLDHFHPSSTQPSARYLTSWDRWTTAPFAILSDVPPPPGNMDSRVGLWGWGVKWGKYIEWAIKWAPEEILSSTMWVLSSSLATDMCIYTIGSGKALGSDLKEV